MLNKRITYSLPVLKTLLSSKTSCVYCFENCKRCFFTNPLQIGNIKAAVTEHLKSKVTSYDSELQGIILSHKNIKVVNYVQLSDEGEYSLDYIADIYIFKPTVGSILTGKANKKSQDHLGVLVHSVFNATLPRPRFDEGCPKKWVGAFVKIGEEVTFEVAKVNLLSRLPYIKGKLISVEERDTEDGDSGIGGHESTEESPSNAMGPFSSSDVDCDVVNETKKKQKGKRKSSILSLQSSLLNEILGSPSSSDHSENKTKEGTPVDYDSPTVKKSAMKFVKDRSMTTYENILNSEENNMKSRKRKSSSSLLDIENSLIKSAFERLSSPELCGEDAPKVKKRKISNTRDDKVGKQGDDFKNFNFAESSSKEDVMDSSVSVTNMESTINDLINSQMNSFTPKKKKLSKELHEKEETDSNEISHNSSIASSERKKKKSLDKEQTKQKIENTNAISLSEQSQRLLQLAEQGNIFSETTPKKRKKKKSKESFLLENSEKADEIMNSSEDSIQSVKKKKKSVSFQNPVISTVNNSEFGVSEEQLQESILNSPEPTKTKSVTREEKDINLSYLSNKGPESSQIQNHNDSMEEETSIKRDKKKKKRKSSLLPETEKCLLDISYTEPLNEDIQVDSVEKDSLVYNKEHKKKKKKKSIATQETEESLSMVNYTEENKQIQNIYNELEQDSDHKKKKKKRSLIQEENITDSSLSNQIEPDLSFSEMPPPSATKVKKRKFSEVEPLEVETDSFNEITQVKKKKKKSRDVS